MRFDFGLTDSFGAHYLAQRYRKNEEAAKSSNADFAEIAAAKAAGTESVRFEDMLKSKHPNAYYNVMGTSGIDRTAWGRTDYPMDAFFKEPADESVLNNASIG